MGSTGIPPKVWQCYAMLILTYNVDFLHGFRARLFSDKPIWGLCCAPEMDGKYHSVA
jgi:hypothetical protein